MHGEAATRTRRREPCRARDVRLLTRAKSQRTAVAMSDAERESLKQSLRWRFEQTLDERTDRYLSVRRQCFVGAHYFAHPSTEALNLYRDGYFWSCIMLTQSVAEGIVRFVAERNGVSQQLGESKQALAGHMARARILSQSLVDSFSRIQGSFRNDFHHMNPSVGRVDLEALAKRNILDLATIEREIFEWSHGPDGTLVLKNPQYWDVRADGSVLTCVRLA